MMRRVIFLLPVFFCFLEAMGSDPKYPVSAIPEELKKDVNIVVREDKAIYRILSKAKGRLYGYYVVTILNSNGNGSAVRSFGYDKLSKIRDLNAAAYNAEGKLIKKLRNSEVYDHSAFDGFSLYSDTRIKSVDLSQTTYPYTVEFEYEIEYDYLYDFGGSTILSDEKISVQHASYEIIFPSDLPPRYKALNTDVKPKSEKTSDGYESLTWTFENIKPIELEPYGPDGEKIFPAILAAPSHFEYGGYEGDMSNWKEFGKWSLLLNKGRDELPDAAKQKIKELTANINSTEEKIKVLYAYLQSRTRYVSIQLGLGGFQPFPASVVDQYGYGDCKALSNYMVAMLKEIGIKGYYTLIMSGDDAADVMEDFPSDQSDHVIVCVPNKADTIWLECTSQTNPFGYQGRFTCDRKALVITENGGAIVNTTRYTASQNRQSRSADVYVDATGNGKAKIRTLYTGLQYENGGLDFILDDQFDDQKKWIQKSTDIPSFDINSFSMINKKERMPSAIVNLDLTLNRLASLSGKRLFLTPNLMNRSSFSAKKLENRKTNVVRRTAYTDYDTIRYHLPQEIYPEFLPEPVKLSSRFGEYQATFKMDQGMLIYTRKIVMKKGEYPADSYAELVDFFKNITKADNAKIVFLNKT